MELAEGKFILLLIKPWGRSYVDDGRFGLNAHWSPFGYWYIFLGQLAENVNSSEYASHTRHDQL